MKNYNILLSWNSLVPTLLEPGSSKIEPGRSKLGFYSTMLLPAGSKLSLDSLKLEDRDHLDMIIMMIMIMIMMMIMIIMMMIMMMIIMMIMMIIMMMIMMMIMMIMKAR